MGKGGPKISTIMVSYLGWYPGSRTNPVEKFNRAVKSWLAQTITNKELVIVSDGCVLTNQAYQQNWAQHQNIKLIEMPKSKSTWPGSLRQVGVDQASGDWITYLDSDDIYLPDYLERIQSRLQQYPNQKHIVNMAIAQVLPDWQANGPQETISIVGKRVKLVNVTGPHLLPNGTANWAAYKCTSTRFATHCLIHHRTIQERWQDSNTAGEDLQFSDTWPDPFQIYEPGYIICHLPDRLDY